MGRKQKVTAQEILEAIQESGTVTKTQLAEAFGVCSATVKSRLSELRTDGEGLLHNKNGLYILESIQSEEDRLAYEKYVKWLVSTFKGIAKCGKVTKPLLLESRKYMQEQLTKEERQLLTSYTAQVNRILTNIEFEEDMNG